MIDLSKTHRDMLVAIGFTAGTAPVVPATDPRCLTEEVASSQLTGSSRDDLFPPLEIVLTQRFSRVSKEILMRDLLGPLKNGLGNAFKHGNGRDRKKKIFVQAQLTPRGACIAITDEGPGFDVAATLERFREDDHYYNNHGMGFRNFSRAASTLSYTHGGRTLLLCFTLPQGQRHRPPEHAPATQSALDPPGDLPERLRTLLQEDRAVALDPKDCIGIYGPRPDEPGSHRCILTSARGDVVAVYTLQAFPTLAAARAEYTAARVMFESITRQKIHVPRPVALFEEPPLVVYDFAPSMNLWTYLANRGDARALEKMSRRLGIVLGRHHGTPLDVPEETWADTRERWARALERAHRSLLPLDPEAAARLKSLRETLLQQAQRARQESGAPRHAEDRVGSFDTVVHGSLGWDCIHYGVDGRFYLSRFQHCRKGHPALDLGGYLADLLAYGDRTGESATYPSGMEALIHGYCIERDVPWIAELPLFIAGTLVERIAALATWCAKDRESGSSLEAGSSACPDWARQLDPARLVTLCARVLDGESFGPSRSVAQKK